VALLTWALLDLRLISPPQDPALVAASPQVLGACGQELPVASELAAELPPILYPLHPQLGDNIGTLTLPTLNLSWPIYEGTTEEQLALGVGHFQDSVLPGIIDNSVLSGHRTTVFGRLGELAEGDLIVVGTSAGVFTYQISGFRIVDRTSLDVIVPTPTAVLTLTTCYPFDSLVPTTQAFIVTADLVDSRLNDE
jgi:sortase A